ncbi:MAG TPA: SPW repeat protein [Gemmatimonadales bacterium]|nr:SPW repeat protein [Gemmatimonadales bacterium]
MRVIPTRVHAVFDYGIGLLLVVSPWLFDFARGDAATWVPVAVGGSMVGYSLMTDYERGVVRRIPMPLHLALDVVGGVLLLVSPWLFQFFDYVWTVHVLIGCLAIVVALTTWRTAAFTKGGAPADGWLY